MARLPVSSKPCKEAFCTLPTNLPGVSTMPAIRGVISVDSGTKRDGIACSWSSFGAAILPCLARFSGSQSEGLVTTWRKRRPQCHLNTLSWMHSWLGASMPCGLRIRRNVKNKTSTCDFNILFSRQLYMLFLDSDFRSWMTSRSRFKEDRQTVQ